MREPVASQQRLPLLADELAGPRAQAALARRSCSDGATIGFMALSFVVGLAMLTLAILLLIGDKENRESLRITFQWVHACCFVIVGVAGSMLLAKIVLKLTHATSVGLRKPAWHQAVTVTLIAVSCVADIVTLGLTIDSPPPEGWTVMDLAEDVFGMAETAMLGVVMILFELLPHLTTHFRRLKSIFLPPAITISLSAIIVDVNGVDGSQVLGQTTFSSISTRCALAFRVTVMLLACDHLLRTINDLLIHPNRHVSADKLDGPLVQGSGQFRTVDEDGGRYSLRDHRDDVGFGYGADVVVASPLPAGADLHSIGVGVHRPGSMSALALAPQLTSPGAGSASGSSRRAIASPARGAGAGGGGMGAGAGGLLRSDVEDDGDGDGDGDGGDDGDGALAEAIIAQKVQQSAAAAAENIVGGIRRNALARASMFGRRPCVSIVGTVVAIAVLLMGLPGALISPGELPLRRLYEASLLIQSVLNLGGFIIVAAMSARQGWFRPLEVPLELWGRDLPGASAVLRLLFPSIAAVVFGVTFDWEVSAFRSVLAVVICITTLVQGVTYAFVHAQAPLSIVLPSGDGDADAALGDEAGAGAGAGGLRIRSVGVGGGSGSAMSLALPLAGGGTVIAMPVAPYSGRFSLDAAAAAAAAAAARSGPLPPALRSIGGGSLAGLHGAAASSALAGARGVAVSGTLGVGSGGASGRLTATDARGLPRPISLGAVSAGGRPISMHAHSASGGTVSTVPLSSGDPAVPFGVAVDSVTGRPFTPTQLAAQRRIEVSIQLLCIVNAAWNLTMLAMCVVPSAQDELETHVAIHLAMGAFAAFFYSLSVGFSWQLRQLFEILTPEELAFRSEALHLMYAPPLASDAVDVVRVQSQRRSAAASAAASGAGIDAAAASLNPPTATALAASGGSSGGANGGLPASSMHARSASSPLPGLRGQADGGSGAMLSEAGSINLGISSGVSRVSGYVPIPAVAEMRSLSRQVSATTVVPHGGGGAGEESAAGARNSSTGDAFASSGDELSMLRSSAGAMAMPSPMGPTSAALPYGARFSAMLTPTSGGGAGVGVGVGVGSGAAAGAAATAPSFSATDPLGSGAVVESSDGDTAARGVRGGQLSAGAGAAGTGPQTPRSSRDASGAGASSSSSSSGLGSGIGSASIPIRSSPPTVQISTSAAAASAMPLSVGSPLGHRYEVSEGSLRVRQLSSESSGSAAAMGGEGGIPGLAGIHHGSSHMGMSMSMGMGMGMHGMAGRSGSFTQPVSASHSYNPSSMLFYGGPGGEALPMPIGDAALDPDTAAALFGNSSSGGSGGGSSAAVVATAAHGASASSHMRMGSALAAAGPTTGGFGRMHRGSDVGDLVDVPVGGL